MGLWLEYRDIEGRLIERERFSNGVVPFVARDIPLEEAVKLARLSSHLPVEKREWVLRIGFGEE